MENGHWYECLLTLVVKHVVHCQFQIGADLPIIALLTVILCVFVGDS